MYSATKHINLEKSEQTTILMGGNLAYAFLDTHGLLGAMVSSGLSIFLSIKVGF
jgi:hypothetical protein